GTGRTAGAAPVRNRRRHRPYLAAVKSPNVGRHLHHRQTDSPGRRPARPGMKILWVNSNFMHPTTKGGQIRTLEMLRHLHRWHEIHYVALENPALPEGPARAHEYSSRAYPFRHQVPE